MEATESEAGGEKHLNNVLSQEEIANLPTQIVDKINSYIEQNFGEYLTAKALHLSNKSQLGKYAPVFRDAFTHFKCYVLCTHLFKVLKQNYIQIYCIAC